MRVALALLFAGCGRIGFDGVTDASGDAAVPDTFMPVAPCPGVLPGTLALYPFENGAADASGAHPAMFAGTPGTSEGPRECDTAIAFEGDAADYVAIPDAPAWDLAIGSVSLWLRMRGTGEQGIIGRDALGANDGHIGLLIDSGGRMGLRVQRGGLDSVVCSNGVLPLNQWMHVVVRFGPPAIELEIDGVVQTGTGTLSIFGSGCGTAAPWGIDGNDNPWAIGVNTGRSGEGDLIGVDLPLIGDVDHVRISSSRD